MKTVVLRRKPSVRTHSSFSGSDRRARSSFMLRGASRGGSAADQGASWTPLCGGIWDKSKWEETHNSLEEFHIPSGLGMPGNPTRASGQMDGRMDGQLQC